MSFVRQAGAAAVLVTLTLWFQCFGMAALIHWGRDHLVRSIHRAGPWHSAVLLVRFTNLIICLHIVEIFVGSVLSLALFPIMGSVLLFFDNQLFDCWLWRCSSPANVADPRSRRK